MSLGVAIKGPEGIVLAADSRVTIMAQRQGMDTPLPVNFDNASKLLSFTNQKYVGAVTYGVALIGQRTAHSYVPEFEVQLSRADTGRLNIEDFAKELSEFYVNRWRVDGPSDHQGPGMTFLVGGYDESEAYGSVFLFDIPNKPEPEPRSPDDFGMTWGGQIEVASRIIHGWDPLLPPLIEQALGLDDEQKASLRRALSQLEFTIPYKVLPLQDCVDLATYLIRTTISGQKLYIGVRGVGGLIEVATITRTEGLEFVQKKEIHGEAGI